MPRKPSKLTGYYVTARIDPGTANCRTAWLLGPFDEWSAASRMVHAVERATRKLPDPRYAFAAFGTAKLVQPADKPLPPGKLPLELLDMDDVLAASVDRRDCHE